MGKVRTKAKIEAAKIANEYIAAPILNTAVVMSIDGDGNATVGFKGPEDNILGLLAYSLYYVANKIEMPLNDALNIFKRSFKSISDRDQSDMMRELVRARHG